MAANQKTIEKMSGLVYTLRQKCALKDSCFIQTLNISLAEYNCLIQYFNVDSLAVKVLADRLDITPGGVTRIITSLEEKGLVDRLMSKQDRRGIDVVLTQSGKAMVDKIRSASYAMHEEILQHIEPEHHESVIKAIESLINALNLWIDDHQVGLSMVSDKQ